MPQINIATSPYNHALNPAAFQDFLSNGRQLALSRLIPTDTIQRFYFNFQDVVKWDKDVGFRVGLYNSRSKPTSYDLLDPKETETWTPKRTELPNTIADYNSWRDEGINRLKKRDIDPSKPMSGNIADLAAFWTPFFSWPQFAEEGGPLLVEPERVALASTTGGDVKSLKAGDEASRNSTVVALLPKVPGRNVTVKNLKQEFGAEQIEQMGRMIKVMCETAVL